MSTESTPADDADAPARHSLGRIAAVPDPTPLHPTDRAAAAGPPNGAGGPSDRSADGSFAVVLRGYDRAQVDARLADLNRRIRDETTRAESAEAELAAARAQVRRLQDSTTPTAEDREFGLRVERVLNSAEREAAELRASAAREAESLLDNARQESERARKRTEEALLGRAAKLDDEFAARSAALDAREQESDRLLERARRDAEQIRADAERAASEASAAAEDRAAELLRQAEQTVQRQRSDASRDIGRMAALRDEVHRELGRLHVLLRGELEADRVDVGAHGDDGGSGRALDAGTSDASGDTTDVDDGRDVNQDDKAEAGDRTTTAGDRTDRGDDDANVRTAVGAIPPYTVASIGVLPFGDRSAGGPANGRSFDFGLVPEVRRNSDDDPTAVFDKSGLDDASPTSDDGADDEPKTITNGSRDGARSARNATRSAAPGRGRR